MPHPAVTFLADHRVAVASAVVAFAAAELAYFRFSSRAEPSLGESASNVFAYVVGEALRLATLPLRLGAFVLAGRLAPWSIPTTALAVVACYVLVDLLLYALHRLLHETRIGWAFHSVHHSSESFDLTLGGRVNWLQRLVDDLFYLPLPAIGFDPVLVLAMLELNRFSQFWTHTPMIGRLRWLDGVLNTPSNHRVHHARTSVGATKNYGSNFVVWDRLFGTYERERGELRYGTDLGPLGPNPFRIQLAGLRRILAERRSRREPSAT